MTPLELEYSKMRISVESPVHGPKILAYVAELEALRGHTMNGECWCGPETVGVEVRHR